MSEAWLETAEDLAWLREVHGVEAKFAHLIGSECCPTRVDVYSKNHYKALERVYKDEDGTLRLVWTKGPGAGKPPT